MDDDLGHGPRLSGEEYDRRITDLYENLPEKRWRDDQARIRRQEMEIAIDYRLGRDFPDHLREKMWQIQQQVEKRRSRSIFKFIFKKLLNLDFDRDAQKLSEYLINEYSKILSESECREYFSDSDLAEVPNGD